eukprot:snap_masked-scaffold_13-processed-gene-11.47-mRNA-1 protein AED:0.00 eAED:0.00 QI:0/-1/0/1/-1/1/1/0/279
MFKALARIGHIIQKRTMFTKVPGESLFVSEPAARMFGNPANKVTKDWTNENWLKSRFHFSFAEYFDKNRYKYGVLRVMNDDLVQPDRGFGTHPHRDMEIMTYIVHGELTHEDSEGNKETLSSGGVQFMTAGTGVYHSERNENPTNPLRFIQMWIVPRENGLKVNYGSYAGNLKSYEGKITHLASDVNSSVDTPIKINQDANLFVGKLGAKEEVQFEVKEGRKVYFLLVDSEAGESNVEVNGESNSMKTYDGAQIEGEAKVKVHSSENSGSHFIFVEMFK